MTLLARTTGLALALLPSPSRGGVGSGGQRALNFAHYAVEVIKHVVVPKT